MTRGFPLTFIPKAGQRLLMIAPHPDDETLGAGGLLQKAAEGGAEICVLFATNGESNPWPQRVAYRKWRLSPADRNRWGETRRQESRLALLRLGVPPSAARFLNLPDQGITECLMQRPAAIQSLLARHITEWEPTLLLLPSPVDIHRDHNALALLTHQAIQEADLANLSALEYVVHGRSLQAGQKAVTLELSPAEQEQKRQAILCHRTQMMLSQKRFLSYVQPEEHFFPPGSGEGCARTEPILNGIVEDDSIRIEIRLPKTPRVFGPISLLLAFETTERESVRYCLSLPRGEAAVPIFDTIHRHSLRAAAIRQVGGNLVLRIPLGDYLPVSAQAKLHLSLGFHDWAGWKSLTGTESFTAAPLRTAPFTCSPPLSNAPLVR